MEERALKTAQVKVRALLRVCDNLIKQKEEEGNSQVYEMVRTLSKKHSISNLSLMRRFSNPVKDPDPLSSTMISLSYKFPLMMRSDKISMFPKEIVETKGEHGFPNQKMIEYPHADNRKLGWTGCKMGLLDVYLQNSQVPDKEVQDIISTLYQTEREMVSEWNSVDWATSTINTGRQLQERVKIKLGKTLVPNIKNSQIQPLMAKILEPALVVSDEIQFIYDNYKEKFAEALPDKMSMLEQVNALRNMLDPKERYIPLFRMYSNQTYLHSISLFSSQWHATITMKQAQEKDMLHTEKINIDLACNKIVNCLSKESELVQLGPILSQLKIAGTSFYDIIENNSYQEANTNYVVALCGMKTNNVAHLKFPINIYLRFMGIKTSEFGIDQEVHFETRLTSGICFFSSLGFNLNMRWAPKQDIEKIVDLMLYLQKNKGNLRKAFFNVNLQRALLNTKKSKIWDSSYHLAENAGTILNNMKLNIHTINKIMIQSRNSPHVITIEDNVTTGEPLVISEYQESTDTPPIFNNVNGMSMWNHSYFISAREPSMAQLEYKYKIDEEHPLLSRNSICFLPCLNIKDRLLSVYLSMLADPHLMKRASELEFTNYATYYSDIIPTTMQNNLMYTCATILQSLQKTNKMITTRRELLAFLLMWSGHLESGSISLFYSLKGGLCIDLDFTDSYKTTKNLLWVNEEGKLLFLDHNIADSFETELLNLQVHSIQGRLNGYRLELTDREGKSTSLQIGVSKLSREEDGSSIVVTQMGHNFLLIRDRNFGQVRYRSLERLKKNLKRTTFFSNNLFSKKPKLDM
uniref:PB2 n=1 Tax=Longchuan virus TaxID=2594109 RepID=A0A514YA82_9ORTO|nr:PB2 [Longchuan virus]